MALNARFGGYSDIGKIREKNEDNFFVSSELKLAIVADGMGGHNAGEVASSLAVAVFGKVLEDLHKGKLEMPKKFLPTLPPEERAMLLAADMANNAVFDMAKSAPYLNTMGTTLSAIHIVGNEGLAVHVGDTRIYLYRAGLFTQLTTDHSLAYEQIRRGVMTKGEAEKSRVQNVLTRALGIARNAEFDLLKISLLPGDILLLCSDGLNKGLSDEELGEIVSRAEVVPLGKLCKLLVKKANEHDGKDNISAVLIRIMPPAPEKKKRLFSWH